MYVDTIEAIAARAEAIAAVLPPGEALVEWLNELSLSMIQVRGLKALLGSAVAESSPAVLTACGTSLTGGRSAGRGGSAGGDAAG